MAVDSNNSEVVTWDGGAWHGYELSPPSSNYFFAVSCAARNACAEIGNNGDGGNNVVGWWNGHDWGVENLNDDSRFGPKLQSVSCASVTFCMAVGSDAGDGAGEGEAVAWNGSRWGRVALPSPLADAVAVSCVSRTECVAVNATASINGNAINGTSVATFNGSDWTTTASAFHAYPTAISCPVTGWCMVVGALLNLKTDNPVTPAAASVR